RGVTLRLLAAAGPPEDRRRLVNEAVAVLRECGDRLGLAQALADLGDVHRAAGEDGKADVTLRQARHMARLCGVETLVTGVPAAPAAVEVTGELSDAELRVAELAAHGLTNRQIAGKLYITVSTVEQHLTRVYRKLAVGRRTDLAQILLTGIVDSA
ncbi:MAG TPA: helix-turn-helix transcriptional regulator, partial [Thermomonospora sp.]|nr:helix-turn-helix transcriptional regulator [Thermomonospora sp.]